MDIKREHQINLLYVIGAFVVMLLLQSLFFESTHVKEIPYSEFQKLAADGKLADVVVRQSTITGTLKDAKESEPKHFSTNKVDPALADALAKDKLTFSAEAGPGLIQTILGWLLPTLGFVLLWMFLIRPMTGQGAGGLMAIGKSKAKIYI